LSANGESPEPHYENTLKDHIVHAAIKRFEVWLKGLLAAAISGAAGGVLTGLAAVGIDPQHFNLQAGIGSTMRIGLAAAVINSVTGVAAYLHKSPLPSDA
jgi:hypothetical protein